MSSIIRDATTASAEWPVTSPELRPLTTGEIDFVAGGLTLTITDTFARAAGPVALGLGVGIAIAIGKGAGVQISVGSIATTA